MPTDALDGDGLAHVLRAGLASVRAHAPLLDELNVYPIPDGDTGINMASTLAPLAEALERGGHDLPGLLELLDRMAGHSRGNSGFILARFFSGFSRTSRGAEVVDGPVLARAFEAGSYLSRTSLLDPVEGTMLTALSAMDEALSGFEGGVDEGLARAVEACEQAVHTTPSLLPVLARAGVVDAGALGLLVLVEGMARGLQGQEPRVFVEADWRFEPVDAPEGGIERIKHRYCTELVLRSPATRDQLVSLLSEAGDSVGLMAEEGLVKLHVHTSEPEALILQLQELGEVVGCKIEDMQAQIEQAALRARQGEGCAVVAVVPGPGFAHELADLGAAATVNASDRLPSAQDLTEAIESVEASTVIVLPNDKNAIPAVTVAAQASDKEVLLLPTRDVVQGMAALFGWSEVEPAEVNLLQMAESMDASVSMGLYRATRDSRFGDVQLQQGQHFCTVAGELVSSAPTAAEAVSQALEGLDLSERGCVTAFTGLRFAGEVEEIEAAILQQGPHLVVEWRQGGQKKSELLLSVD